MPDLPQASNNLPAAACSGACPICCYNPETAERLIEIRTESTLRSRALTLSAVVTVLILFAHIFFSYYGKILPIPEIVWAIILAPWCGAGAGKVVEMVTQARIGVKK